MSAQKIWMLAQEGHPIAIATLFNYITRSYGTKTRVQRQGDRLHILIEATLLPDPQASIEFVQSSIKDLNVQHITTVTVYGRRQGERLPGWQQTIHLADGLTDDLTDNLTDNQTGDLAEFQAKTALNSPDLSDQSVRSSAIHPGHASFTSIKPVEVAPVEVKPVEPAPVDLLAPFPAVPPPFLPMEASEIPDILKRPQAIVLIVFAALLIFWDAYTSLLEEDDVVPTAALSTSQLARRLQTSNTTIRNRKRLNNFSDWTQTLDPDGIAWIYRKGVYIPRALEVAEAQAAQTQAEGQA